MELIRDINNILPRHKNCVVTIGNFDGVHKGHQHLLACVKKEAVRLGVPSVVITFEPQAHEYFHPERMRPRLTHLREKIIAFEHYGIDRVLCIRFNKAFSEMTAETFIQEVLVDKLAAQFVMIGDDFKFGFKREGSIALLKKMGEALSFEASAANTLLLDDRRVSSTRVRDALENGDLNEVEHLIGRPYGLAGRVAHGNKRGRIIGFPTANIYLHRKSVPISGVYAVTARGFDEKIYYGVANVGTRPTFNGTRSLLEVHIFDFDQTIYGAHIYVEFCKKLREEKKYDDFEALKKQIFKDAEEARGYFSVSSRKVL